MEVLISLIISEVYHLLYYITLLNFLTAHSAYNEIGGHVDVEGGGTGGHNNE